MYQGSSELGWNAWVSASEVIKWQLIARACCCNRSFSQGLRIGSTVATSNLAVRYLSHYCQPGYWSHGSCKLTIDWKIETGSRLMTMASTIHPSSWLCAGRDTVCAKMKKMKQLPRHAKLAADVMEAPMLNGSIPHVCLVLSVVCFKEWLACCELAGREGVCLSVLSSTVSLVACLVKLLRNPQCITCFTYLNLSDNPWESGLISAGLLNPFPSYLTTFWSPQSVILSIRQCKVETPRIVRKSISA